MENKTKILIALVVFVIIGFGAYSMMNKKTQITEVTTTETHHQELNTEQKCDNKAEQKDEKKPETKEEKNLKKESVSPKTKVTEKKIVTKANAKKK